MGQTYSSTWVIIILNLQLSQSHVMHIRNPSLTTILEKSSNYISKAWKLRGPGPQLVLRLGASTVMLKTAFWFVKVGGNLQNLKPPKP